MLDLLRWHGAEEVEHRAVAFDLFQHEGGGYFHRLVGLAEVGPVLLWLWARGTFFLMRNDPTLPGRPRLRAFLRSGRAGTLPSLRELLSTVPRFVRPSYHPLAEGSTAQAVAYLAASPAAQATAARA
jgi:hypothetical protein